MKRQAINARKTNLFENLAEKKKMKVSCPASTYPEAEVGALYRGDGCPQT